jgi:chromatin segregation and condensation protein Rec8/ScpA/Scc1 (kleisin family)
MQVKEDRFITVREIRPTLEEKLVTLREILDVSGRFEWDLYSEEDRNERVATILGMLELVKIRTATLTQRRPFGRIVLKRREFGSVHAAEIAQEPDEVEIMSEQ